MGIMIWIHAYGRATTHVGEHLEMLTCALSLLCRRSLWMCTCGHVGNSFFIQLPSQKSLWVFFFCDHFLQIETEKDYLTLISMTLWVLLWQSPSYNVTSSSHYNILDPDIHVDATSHKPPTQTLWQMKHTIQGTDTPRWHPPAAQICRGTLHDLSVVLMFWLIGVHRAARVEWGGS